MMTGSASPDIKAVLEKSIVIKAEKLSFVGSAFISPVSTSSAETASLESTFFESSRFDIVPNTAGVFLLRLWIVNRCFALHVKTRCNGYDLI